MLMSIHAGIVIVLHICTTVEGCFKNAALQATNYFGNNRGHLSTRSKGHPSWVLTGTIVRAD